MGRTFREPPQTLQTETVLLMDLEGVLPRRQHLCCFPVIQMSPEGAPAFTSSSAAPSRRARKTLLSHPSTPRAAWNSLSPLRVPRWRCPAAQGPCRSGSGGCSPGTPPALPEASRAGQPLAQRSTRPARDGNQALMRPSHSVAWRPSQDPPPAHPLGPIPLPSTRPLTTHRMFFWRVQTP